MTHARGDRQGVAQRSASGAAVVRSRWLAFRVVLGQLSGLLFRCRLSRGRPEPARTRRQPHREAISRMFHRGLRRRCPRHGRRPGRSAGDHRAFPGRLRPAALPGNPRCPCGGPGGLRTTPGRAGTGNAHLEPPSVDLAAVAARRQFEPGSSVPRPWFASTCSAHTRPTTSWNRARPACNPRRCAPP